jgi:hypothetical protein
MAVARENLKRDWRNVRCKDRDAELGFESQGSVGRRLI